MNEVETQFNALYQKTLAFYENAMNGDKTHPFVLFKIKQLRLKKSNFKKVKGIDNDLLASALRTILLEDLQSFVEDVKEYELKMKALNKRSKIKKPVQNNKFTLKSNNKYPTSANKTKPSQETYNKQPRQDTRQNTQYVTSHKPVTKTTTTEYTSSKPVLENTRKEKPIKSNAKYMKAMDFRNKKGKR